MFDAGTYRNRRNSLLQKLSGQRGLLVFMGNELTPMNYTDNTFPFRQDSSFLYFFGLDLPSLTAVIDLDSGRETLFGNDLTVEEIVWMGAQPDMREKAQACGVTDTAGLNDFTETLLAARRQDRTIHLLPQYQPGNIIKLAERLETPVSAVGESVSDAFTRAVIALRSIKSPAEIEQIEQSVHIAGQMHRRAMQATRAGMAENQVAAEMQQLVTSLNCRMAFPVIFTRRGEILHNHVCTNTLRKGDLVINDSGVENPLRYASDITRTIPVGGRFSNRQREIYDLVLTALNQAVARVAPGVEFRTVHLHACTVLAEGLKQLGLMKGDISHAVERGAHALFFPCGLGHMMGLDVHDMEGLGEDRVGYTDTICRSEQFGLRSLRLAKVLKPGYVLTVEPGIYFIPPLIEQWQGENKFTDCINYDRVRAYLDFGGIRIEDDVLVTSDGVHNLSPDIPKNPEQVESLTGSL